MPASARTQRGLDHERGPVSTQASWTSTPRGIDSSSRSSSSQRHTLSGFGSRSPDGGRSGQIASSGRTARGLGSCRSTTYALRGGVEARLKSCRASMRPAVWRIDQSPASAATKPIAIAIGGELTTPVPAATSAPASIHSEHAPPLGPRGAVQQAIDRRPHAGADPRRTAPSNGAVEGPPRGGPSAPRGDYFSQGRAERLRAPSGAALPLANVRALPPRPLRGGLVLDHRSCSCGFRRSIPTRLVLPTSARKRMKP